MAVLLPLSGSESGSQSRSLSVFVARHDLSGSITIADCGCDTDPDSDPDGLLSLLYFRNRLLDLQSRLIPGLIPWHPLNPK